MRIVRHVVLAAFLALLPIVPVAADGEGQGVGAGIGARPISHVVIVRVRATLLGPVVRLERVIVGSIARYPDFSGLLQVRGSEEAPHYHRLPLRYRHNHRYLVVFSSRLPQLQSVSPSELVSVVDLDEGPADAELRRAMSGEDVQDLPQGYSRENAQALLSEALGEEVVRAFGHMLSASAAKGELGRKSIMYLLGRPYSYSEDAETGQWRASYPVWSAATHGWTSFPEPMVTFLYIKMRGQGAAVTTVAVERWGKLEPPAQTWLEEGLEAMSRFSSGGVGGGEAPGR